MEASKQWVRASNEKIINKLAQNFPVNKDSVPGNTIVI